MVKSLIVIPPCRLIARSPLAGKAQLVRGEVGRRIPATEPELSQTETDRDIHYHDPCELTRGGYRSPFRMAPPLSYVCGDLAYAVSYGSYHPSNEKAGKGVGLTLAATLEAMYCQLRADAGWRGVSTLIFSRFWLVEGKMLWSTIPERDGLPSRMWFTQ